eukprot:scaffold93239_cov30-Tisochrysis_lutea.AAC.2
MKRLTVPRSRGMVCERIRSGAAAIQNARIRPAHAAGTCHTRYWVSRAVLGLTRPSSPACWRAPSATR